MKSQQITFKNEIQYQIVFVSEYKKVLTKFYDDHNSGAYHKFWEDLSKMDEKYKYKILEDTFNVHNGRANSLLYKENMPNNTKFIDDSFPDKSYYWVYDDYSKIDKYNILYGTYEVQRKIWKHQNPMTCQNQKYIYISNWPFGLGSQLMTYGLLLTHALSMNRIMLWNPKGSFPYFKDSNFCKSIRTFDCIFQPLSNCTPSAKDNILKMYASPRWMRDARLVLPSLICSIINKTSIPRSAYEWYWRAQAMTFLIRPKPNILELFKTKAKEISTNGSILNHIPISIYIRHGDKGREMALINDRYYLSTLYNVFDFVHLNSKTPVLLVTQDPDSIEFFKKSGIKMSYLETRRSHKIQNGDFQYFDNMILSFIEIWAMVRSKYIITTRKSNFDLVRLALQQTVGFRTDAMNFEVGNIPCLTAVHCHYLKRELTFRSF